VVTAAVVTAAVVTGAVGARALVGAGRVAAGGAGGVFAAAGGAGGVGAAADDDVIDVDDADDACSGVGGIGVGGGGSGEGIDEVNDIEDIEDIDDARSGFAGIGVGGGSTGGMSDDDTVDTDDEVGASALRTCSGGGGGRVGDGAAGAMAGRSGTVTSRRVERVWMASGSVVTGSLAEGLVGTGSGRLAGTGRGKGYVAGGASGDGRRKIVGASAVAWAGAGVGTWAAFAAKARPHSPQKAAPCGFLVPQDGQNIVASIVPPAAGLKAPLSAAVRAADPLVSAPPSKALSLGARSTIRAGRCRRGAVRRRSPCVHPNGHQTSDAHGVVRPHPERSRRDASDHASRKSRPQTTSANRR
jgi:hypothetical protein